ncbi:unnamed protein product, partial [Prunus brigantina]
LHVASQVWSQPFAQSLSISLTSFPIGNYLGTMHMEGDAQEEYHITQGPGAQELETLRNKIAASLMHASS